MTRYLSYVCLLLLLVALPRALKSQSESGAGRATISTALPPGGCDVAFASATATQGAAGRGFSPANLDRSVSPCTDFFKFADGGWVKDHPIPPAYGSWGTFSILHDRNQDHLHDILEQAAKDKTAKPGTNWRKIGDFYASCMDVRQIEADGLKPVEPELQRIAAIHDAASLQAEVTRLQREGVSAVFRFGSEQDLKDSSQQIAVAAQGGLGLPDRQYYLKDDARSKQLRDAYTQHVTNMFKLMGDSAETASSEARTVMAVELALAKASMDRVDMRDPDNIYHRMPVAQLRTLAPRISWGDYFKAVSAPAISDINVAQPDFFKEVDSAFQSVPLADWKVYLRWHLIHAAAPALPEKFVLENFNFYTRTLTGAKEMRPRWRRCVEATDRQLGEALGQYYVKQYFPPEAKAQAIVMVKNLEAALHADLTTLDWMTPATRQQAIKKLDAITLKIGYPDKWRDYSALQVGRGDYIDNVERGDEFEFARDVAKIGKPVDRGEWDMTPPTVNAYYNPSMNEIVFPAGILQPPFFNPNGDPAINYGGMGAVIGHEMTHGFDDEGSRFDAVGNLKNWWTPDDLKNFKARGDCVANQFDGYEVEPGLHEQGKLVEGESIADLGGLTISYAAFQKTLEGKPTQAPVDGFTPEQRFFLGFAQIWAGSDRPEQARMQTKTNEHPLERFRTNGPLSNMASFSKVWGCSAKSPMVRPKDKVCRIW